MGKGEVGEGAAAAAFRLSRGIGSFTPERRAGRGWRGEAADKLLVSTEGLFSAAAIAANSASACACACAAVAGGAADVFVTKMLGSSATGDWGFGAFAVCGDLSGATAAN